MSTPDPVSWKVIEHGWPVYDAEGAECGKVAEIAGDVNADIFDGLSIKEGVAGRARYVPAEVVGVIRDGEVHLTISGARVATLEDMRTAAEEKVIPESSTWYQRIAWWLTGRDR
jgi:hypothetical protein